MTRIAIKRILYHAGLLRLWNRVRNRDTLTVVMFHRVLPEGSRERQDADPAWTLSTDTLRQCLDFFKREYSVVSLEDLRRARAGRDVLPRNALLITFDDGWKDNAEHALQVLRAAGLPALIFVVAGLLRDTQAHGHLEQTFDPCSLEPSPFTSADSDLEQHMLSGKDLINLEQNGCTIGSHGWTHCPLPQARDRRRCLGKARARLAEWLARPESESVLALSFPHGQYDASSVRDALEAGHEILFTSDQYLNRKPLSPECKILGRIHIPEHEIRDAENRFRPELLATWLFFRPQRALRVSS